MIVCICRGASEKDVQTAIDGGVGCLQELRRCGIGGDCHGCENTLRDMIEERAGSQCAACQAPLEAAM